MTIKNKDNFEKFNYIIYKENLWKFILFGSIFGLVELGLALSTPLIFGDYVTLLRALIVAFSFLVVALMIIIYINYEKLYKLAPATVYTIILVILLWATEISIASQVSTDNIMIYLATMLVFANISIFDWRIKTVLLIIPQIWFVVNIGINITDSAKLVSHYVNSNLVLIISIMLSYYIYKLKRENYTYTTTIEKQNTLLRDLTLLDSMTGINNHNSIYTILKQEIEYSKRYKTPLSIVMFDIDHFKNINDTYGHVFGDTVIKEISNQLKERTRATDHIGRYGGEEFIIILPNTGLIDAFTKANTCRRKIEEHTFESNVTLTISAGVIEWKNETAEQLVHTADQLMYKAKENGRNRVEKTLK